MITLRVIRAAAATLYFFGAVGGRSYGSYLDEEAAHGFFWGRGAARDGLHGKPVTEAAFDACAHGYSPDGREQRVTLRAYSNREPRGGFDTPFATTKHFSIIVVGSQEEHRAELLAAGDRAARRAVDYGEELLYSRRGKAGQGEKDPVEATVAVMRHTTSRPVAGARPDPNVHWHCVWLAPACRTTDETYGTFEVRPLFQAQWALSRLFDVGVAAELRRLGYELELDEAGQLGVVGIPRSAVERFSKRSRLVEDFKRRNPDARIDEVKAFVVHSRQGKSTATFKELLPSWQGELEAQGVFPELLRRRPKEVPAVEASVVQQEAEFLGRAQSTYTEPELVRKVAERYLLTGADPKDVVDSVRRHLGESQDVVSLGRAKDNFERFSARETLGLEEKLLASADEVAARCSPVPEKKLGRVLSRFSHLTSDQQHLVERFARGDGLVVCEGWAGTGKTTALAAVRELAESAGFKVVGFAPSGRASREVAGAGIDSQTLASRFYRSEVSESQMAAYRAHQHWRVLTRRKTFSFKAGERLTSRHLVVIDEGSMVSTQDAARIFRQAAGAGARVLLVGDSNQLHHPVEASGAFKALKSRFGAVRLSEVVRQRRPWMREVVKALYYGAPETALSIAAAEGALRICSNDEVARRVLIERWERSRTEDLSDTLIVASTNVEVRELNREAQARRIATGEIGGRRAKCDGAHYFQGDRVVFNVNVPSLGVNGVVNGDFGDVVRVSPGDLGNPWLLIKLDRKFQSADGERDICVRVSASQLRLKRFGERRSLISHGYAVTTHKAQGATVDRSFVLLRKGLSREEAIVQLTRSRDGLELFASEDAAGEDLGRLASTAAHSRSQAPAQEQRSTYEEQQSFRVADLPLGVSMTQSQPCEIEDEQSDLVALARQEGYQ